MLSVDGVDMKWYVIHTKPRQELRALENLQKQNYEAFCPMILLEKVRRGKLASVVEPLFSRYIFIQLDTTTSNWAPISYTLGVSKIVRFGSLPTPVPDSLINLLKDQDGQVQERLFSTGDEVKFADGPLKGVSGIFKHHDGEMRALVLIELMSQPQLIKVDTKTLVPLN